MSKESSGMRFLWQEVKEVFVPDNKITVGLNTKREYKWENVSKKNVAFITAISSIPALATAVISWVALTDSPGLNKAISPVFTLEGIALSRMWYVHIKRVWKERYQRDIQIKEANGLRKSS